MHFLTLWFCSWSSNQMEFSWYLCWLLKYSMAYFGFSIFLIVCCDRDLKIPVDVLINLCMVSTVNPQRIYYIIKCANWLFAKICQSTCNLHTVDTQRMNTQQQWYSTLMKKAPRVTTSIPTGGKDGDRNSYRAHAEQQQQFPWGFQFPPLPTWTPAPARPLACQQTRQCHRQSSQQPSGPMLRQPPHQLCRGPPTSTCSAGVWGHIAGGPTMRALTWCWRKAPRSSSCSWGRGPRWWAGTGWSPTWGKHYLRPQSLHAGVTP